MLQVCLAPPPTLMFSYCLISKILTAKVEKAISALMRGSLVMRLAQPSLLAKNADEYRKLAIELDIDSGFVRGLSGDDNVVKLDEVIGKWMKTELRSSPVTWCTIIEAVESDTFGNNVELADKIRNWLEKDENFSYYCED